MLRECEADSVCKHFNIRTHMRMCMYIYICIYVYMYICIYVSIYVTYICRMICVYICIHVYRYITCIFASIYHLYTYICICTYVFMAAHVDANMGTYANPSTCPARQAWILKWSPSPAKLEVACLPKCVDRSSFQPHFVRATHVCL